MMHVASDEGFIGVAEIGGQGLVQDFLDIGRPPERRFLVLPARTAWTKRW
jgi:hypothetical protein